MRSTAARILPQPSAPLWPPGEVQRSVAEAGTAKQLQESRSAEASATQLGASTVAAANLGQQARSSLADFRAPAGSVDFWQPVAYDEASSAEGRGAAAAEEEEEGGARL